MSQKNKYIYFFTINIDNSVNLGNAENDFIRYSSVASINGVYLHRDIVLL